ncbi:hypothetical protein DMUE_2321 [Dictyocoela muelleri]|nr:hypothetical protein DMUE_2321 [Dictyocoela muelleri]
MVFATVISNKKMETLFPLFMKNLALGSTICTGEYLTYKCFSEFDYIHDAVCHKYEFKNSLTGSNNQSMESLNNIIKQAIKQRKVVLTGLRHVFLNLIRFKFNNKHQELVVLLFN